MALSFLAAVLIIDPVYDKQTGVIRLLRLSNADGLLQWLPIFVVHIITHWIPILFSFVIFCNIWRTNFIQKTSTTVFVFTLLTFLFVLVMTVLAYCVSMLFKKVSTALATNLIVSLSAAIFISFAVVALGGTMIGNFSNSGSAIDTRQAKSIMVTSFILPWWSYVGGLVGLIINYYSSVASASVNVWQPKVWNDLCVAGIESLIFWLVVTTLLLSVFECISGGAIRTTMSRVFCKSSTVDRMREQLDLDKQTSLFAVNGNHLEDNDVRAERYSANKTVTFLTSRIDGSDTEM